MFLSERVGAREGKRMKRPRLQAAIAGEVYLIHMRVTEKTDERERHVRPAGPAPRSTPLRTNEGRRAGPGAGGDAGGARRALPSPPPPGGQRCVQRVQAGRGRRAVQLWDGAGDATCARFPIVRMDEEGREEGL